jgi:hypothetical protein
VTAFLVIGVSAFSICLLLLVFLFHFSFLSVGYLDGIPGFLFYGVGNLGMGFGTETESGMYAWMPDTRMLEKARYDSTTTLYPWIRS